MNNIYAAQLFDGASGRGQAVQLRRTETGLEGRLLNPQGDASLGITAETPWVSLTWHCEEVHGDGFFRVSVTKTWQGLLEGHDPELADWLRSHPRSEDAKNPRKGWLARLSGDSGYEAKGRRFALKITAWVILLLVAVAGLYHFALPTVSSYVTSQLPRSADRLVGAQAMRHLPWDTLTADSAAGAGAKAIQSLLDSLGHPHGLTLRLHVMADTQLVNAFALPGGHILLFPALLRRMKSPAELAGVLAHEAGHEALRHGVRRLVRSSLLGIVTAFTLGDISGAGAVLLDRTGQIMQLAYGREEESEADVFAVKALARLKLDCHGLDSLFAKPLGPQIPGWATFISTHPADEERLKTLKQVRGETAGCTQVPRVWMSDSAWKQLQGGHF